MSVEYWIWLQQVLGYGSEAVNRVISNYTTAEAFYRADDSEKIRNCQLNKWQVERLHSVKRKTVFGIMNDCAKNGINIITPEDNLYSERLLNIADPPAVLYIKGSRFDFNGNPAIAVVGPRNISNYGAKCAFVIADTLASCGFTVVSGGAVGGDSAAHRGAINAGGYTVGVLGCGIESDYLKSNAELRKEVAANGCVISEQPPYEGVKKGAFPRRNRIMSGLCNGVVVIEGSSKSGTLITARHASEQGRDVFVIPGSPSLPQYEGSNRLIADGARPLLSVNDVIKEYVFLYPDKIHEPKKKIDVGEKAAEISDNHIKSMIREQDLRPKTDEERKTAPADRNMLSDLAITVLDSLAANVEGFTADEVADWSKLDIGSVLTAVTELEICGFIESLPGGRYCVKQS